MKKTYTGLEIAVRKRATIVNRKAPACWLVLVDGTPAVSLRTRKQARIWRNAWVQATIQNLADDQARLERHGCIVVQPV